MGKIHYINIDLNNIIKNESFGSYKKRIITKTIFNCLVIANMNDNYYYKVDLIEDYFSYTKYNNVNIYKINIVTELIKNLISSIKNT